MLDYTQFLEPITRENLKDLEPGEWIWDSKLVERRTHQRSLDDAFVTEQKGFRQIHILDLDEFFKEWTYKPFMLGDYDRYAVNSTWEYFENNRYFKFKKMEG